jgi:nucleoid-associated protein YgaU
LKTNSIDFNDVAFVAVLPQYTPTNSSPFNSQEQRGLLEFSYPRSQLPAEASEFEEQSLAELDTVSQEDLTAIASSVSEIEPVAEVIEKKRAVKAEQVVQATKAKQVDNDFPSLHIAADIDEEWGADAFDELDLDSEFDMEAEQELSSEFDTAAIADSEIEMLDALDEHPSEIPPVEPSVEPVEAISEVINPQEYISKPPAAATEKKSAAADDEAMALARAERLLALSQAKPRNLLPIITTALALICLSSFAYFYIQSLLQQQVGAPSYVQFDPRVSTHSAYTIPPVFDGQISKPFTPQEIGALGSDFGTADIEPINTISIVPPAWGVHVVTKNDTLWHIAERYMLDPFRYSDIARWSKIANPDLIHPGDKVIYENVTRFR